MTPDLIVNPEQRARLDQVFMQVVLDVQAQIQQTAPAQSGTLAALFHKEQQAEALQGCAMLIAGWNAGRLDSAGLSRSAKALRGLSRSDLAERLEKLPTLTEDEQS